MVEIVEIGKKYLIIYDDKGNKPVKKIGVLKNISGNLLSFESGEVLNTLNIIRAEIVEGGYSGENGKVSEA